MALDRELFEDFIQNSHTLPLLRIYQVTESAVTLGRSWRGQSPLKGTVPFKGDSLAICIRPTGGGLVRHGDDLIYSVMARRDTFPTFHQVRTSYLSFHEAVQDAFQKLGIQTRLFRSDEAKRRDRKRPLFGRKPGDCFTEPVATDVLIHEQKVAGGGQWRRGEAFLHQGSVRILEGISFESLKASFVGEIGRAHV